jgi:hypothetical protein
VPTCAENYALGNLAVEAEILERLANRGAGQLARPGTLSRSLEVVELLQGSSTKA